MLRSCTMCHFLQTCEEALNNEPIEYHSCKHWKGVEGAEREVRETIIREFGASALRSLLPDKTLSAHKRS